MSSRDFTDFVSSQIFQSRQSCHCGFLQSLKETDLILGIFSLYPLLTSWKIVDGMKGGGLLEEGLDLVPLVAISVGGSGTLSHWWLSQPAKPSSPTTSSCCLQWTSSTVALSLLFVHIVFNARVARVRSGRQEWL